MSRAPQPRCTIRTAPRLLVTGLALLASCGGGDVEAPRRSRASSAYGPAFVLVDPERGRGGQLSEQLDALEGIGYASGSQQASEAYGVTYIDPERSQPGVNLCVSGHGPEAWLMDAQGNVLHRWHIDFESVWGVPEAEANPSRTYWRRVALLPGGDLLAIHEGLGMLRVDRDSTVLWAHRNAAHHDLEVLPSGEILTLTRHARVVPRIHPEKPVLEDFLCVLGPDGELRQRLSVLQAFENSEYAEYLSRAADHGDIFHTNTVEMLTADHGGRLPEAFAAGNVLISMRAIDLLAVVDLELRSVVWALAGEWSKQHQPVLLESGRMLLFDNLGREGKSQVLEFDPLNGKVSWRYPERAARQGRELSTGVCGSAQRLTNGNTLISETEAGRSLEVTEEGELVWEYLSPHRAGPHQEYVAALFEVIRLPLEVCKDWLDPR